MGSWIGIAFALIAVAVSVLAAQAAPVGPRRRHRSRAGGSDRRG